MRSYIDLCTHARTRETVSSHCAGQELPWQTPSLAEELDNLFPSESMLEPPNNQLDSTPVSEFCICSFIPSAKKYFAFVPSASL
mmetsp:Transcript_71901/g.113941  ORF Transcript_71901/g.113941 Transcript_71901/m.113941 type:complete len:84 (+) Transcript_71901:43-294(+)